MVFPHSIYDVPCIQCILVFNALSCNSGITFKVCSRRLYRISCYLISVLCLVSSILLFLFIIFKLLRILAMWNGWAAFSSKLLQILHKLGIQNQIFIHSFSNLSDDRSKASSKMMHPHSAIQSFLPQMRVSSPELDMCY